jgi:hypothetical protein
MNRKSTRFTPNVHPKVHPTKGLLYFIFFLFRWESEKIRRKKLRRPPQLKQAAGAAREIFGKVFGAKSPPATQGRKPICCQSFSRVAFFHVKSPPELERCPIELTPSGGKPCSPTARPSANTWRRRLRMLTPTAGYRRSFRSIETTMGDPKNDHRRYVKSLTTSNL